MKLLQAHLEEAEGDFELSVELSEEAVNKYPDSTWMLGNYGNALERLRGNC